VDGGQHLDQQEYDLERTAFLATKGYKVLRFWNNEVLKNRDRVFLITLKALGLKEDSL
jgi:very-short-patch-repair endonuclease